MVYLSGAGKAHKSTKFGKAGEPWTGPPSAGAGVGCALVSGSEGGPFSDGRKPGITTADNLNTMNAWERSDGVSFASLRAVGQKIRTDDRGVFGLGVQFAPFHA